MKKTMTGAEVRQSFIQFFVERGHTAVASASLVPGGDQTLLFTNAGMVQFKDVFLGTDSRPYTRAVDSQKCMRVAGKHNDLDDVGRDDSHHTFFEMLGNWSFGDYYKKEAIAWAWELLTEVWSLDKSKLWVTVFKDEKGEIPSDDEAAENWAIQQGLDASHILEFGRKSNFWEMADTGPCGPCSEIHIDRGAEFCDKQDVSGHVCAINGDCGRYLELWNLVFIQYNRLSPTTLEPLPAKHVDTGMGFERIVSVIQGVSSNYRTDLLLPLMEEVRRLTGQSESELEEHLTPYRVIADHCRAAAFLIADGVVPGNTGRNYICRMIIRRAARFANKLGLDKPFMAIVAAKVIEIYGVAYPELIRNQKTILANITREEEAFARTVEAGMSHLEDLLNETKAHGSKVLDGRAAFELYATLGLPLELTRDVAREQGLDVDEDGYKSAMEEHRKTSGAGKAFGPLGGDDVDIYRALFNRLLAEGELPQKGVEQNPYSTQSVDGKILAILKDGEAVDAAVEGDLVEIVVPRTGFYIESGGQVSDTGVMKSLQPPLWRIDIIDVRRPAAGLIIHIGKVVSGSPKLGDAVRVEVDLQRRQDIRRNHTATHLLHAALHQVLGEHARQSGSLVAPDRLRFDFTHPTGMTPAEIDQVETIVNQIILGNHPLHNVEKPLQQAMSEGAMALFGEKYGEIVRTITIGEEEVISYELCGGTHVDETGDIGLFLITSEGSAAAGIRRIEAITGRAAYEMVQKRFRLLKQLTARLECSLDEIQPKVESLLSDVEHSHKEISRIRQQQAFEKFEKELETVTQIEGKSVLVCQIPNADGDSLRDMADRFKAKYDSGIVVLASVIDNRPIMITAVTDDLVKEGINAGDLARVAAQAMEGSGGGRPNLAQAGGKNPHKVLEALETARRWISDKLGS